MGLLTGTVTLSDSRTGLRLTTADGSNVILLPPSGEPDQLWTAIEDADGVKLRNEANGNLLAARNPDFNAPVQAASGQPSTPFSTWTETSVEEGLVALKLRDAPDFSLSVSIVRIYPTPVALMPGDNLMSHWVVDKA